MKRDLANFSYIRDASLRRRVQIIFWWIIQNTIFTWFATPNQVRILILRFFGASVGSKIIVRRGVRIHFPWNLTVGNSSWIGERAWLINHAPILIGANVCISQDAIVSSGSHDMYSPTLEYKHASIEIKDVAWLCLRSTVLAGVTVGLNSVVSAGEVLRKSIPDNSLYIENAVRPINYSNE